MISASRICERAASAGRKAFRKYEWMTGGWGYEVPELFIQSQIAIALSGLPHVYASLEVLESDLRRLADKRRGNVSTSKQKRFDIVLFGEGTKPQIICEVKCAKNARSCSEDLRKIRKALRYGWAENGILIAYVALADKCTLKDRFRDIQNNLTKKAGKNFEVVAPAWERHARIFRTTWPETPDDKKRHEKTQNLYWWGVCCYQIKNAT